MIPLSPPPAVRSPFLRVVIHFVAPGIVGGFVGWSPEFMLGHDVSGATLGLVGRGRIAQAVARRAAGFDMTVRYCTVREGSGGSGSGLGHDLVNVQVFYSINGRLQPPALLPALGLDPYSAEGKPGEGATFFYLDSSPFELQYRT